MKPRFGGRRAASDFSTQTSRADDELTRADTSQTPVDRRRFRRVGLDRSGLLESAGVTSEAILDLARDGAGAVSAAAAALGALVHVRLPADEGEPDGLRLPGRVVRTALVVKPVGDATPLPTFHCFACGWTGYLEPGTGRLRTTLERSSGQTFFGETQVGGAAGSDPVAPAECTTCRAPHPWPVHVPLHGCGIRFGELDPTVVDRLCAYLERRLAVRAGGQTPTRKMAADYVPLRFEVAFASPAELAKDYAEHLQAGTAIFESTDVLAIGDEVRVVLVASGGEAHVVVGRVVAKAGIEGGQRYTTTLVGFDEAVRARLRRFVEEHSGSMLRKELSGPRGSTALWVGAAAGLAIGLAVLALALR